MRERPILFSAEMVRAILAGTKSQTRRPVKNLRVRLRHEVSSDLPVRPSVMARTGMYPAKMNPHGAVSVELPPEPSSAVRPFLGVKPQEFDFLCPYAHGHTYLRRHSDGRMAWHIQVPEGQRLWVRETHQFLRMDDGNTICAYRASCEGDSLTYASPGRSTVEAVQVARWRPAIHMPRDASRLTLEVTGVRVERVQAITGDDARAEGFADGAAFMEAWRAMYPDGPLNPWAWCISFRRVG